MVARCSEAEPDTALLPDRLRRSSSATILFGLIMPWFKVATACSMAFLPPRVVGCNAAMSFSPSYASNVPRWTRSAIRRPSSRMLNSARGIIFDWEYSPKTLLALEKRESSAPSARLSRQNCPGPSRRAVCAAARASSVPASFATYSRSAALLADSRSAKNGADSASLRRTRSACTASGVPIA